MKIIENKENCKPVEAFVWDCVSKDYGNFGGVIELNCDQLLKLRRLCDYQIQDFETKANDA